MGENMIAALVVDLLTDLTRLDIEVVARGDRLRYRPRSALTPKLAERLRTHKADLLALLRPAEASGAAALHPGADDSGWSEGRPGVDAAECGNPRRPRSAEAPRGEGNVVRTISPVLFSSKRVDWATPPALFAEIERKYGRFDADVCATAGNAKCAKFFSPEQDGLKQPWTGRCWMNPPYGRTISDWVRKAWESSLAGATVVCLLPSRTDTRWWHTWVLPFGEVCFLPGRVKFGGSVNSAPFPSAVVVFRPAGAAKMRAELKELTDTCISAK